MNPLPLAEIERVYAVQYQEFLMIIAEGYASEQGGSLHIWRSRTKIFPPLFEIYESPGSTGSNPRASGVRIPAVAANVFHGIYTRIQVLSANDRIFPKIVEATEEQYGPADAPGAPELVENLDQWIAVHEFAPSGPAKLRVQGNAILPNLGDTPKLVRAENQSADPKVLLLDIVTEPLTNVQGDLRWSKPTRSRVRYEEETDYPFECVKIEPIQKIIDVENVLHNPSKAKTGGAG